jgi:hypothetical protein
MIPPIVLQLIRPLLLPLGVLLGLFISYSIGVHVGKENVRHEIEGRVVKDAGEAARDVNKVTNLPDDALSSIVFDSD